MSASGRTCSGAIDATLCCFSTSRWEPHSIRFLHGVSLMKAQLWSSRSFLQVCCHIPTPLSDYPLRHFTEASAPRPSKQTSKSTKGTVNENLGSFLKVAKRAAENRLIIKSGGKIVFVPTDEIDCFEAVRNYVRVIAGNEAYVFRESIGTIADKLDPSQFIRIHRSYVVNVSKINEVQSNSDGFIVHLQNGKRLPVSRVYKSALESLWNNGAVRSRS